MPLQTPDPTAILEQLPVAESYAPSADEQELVGQLMTRFQQAQSARLTWERDANFFRVYLEGDQLVVRNRDTDEVLRLSLSQDESNLQSVDNLLRTTNRAAVGKLSRIIPTATVLPGSDDQADLRSAQVGDSLLAFHFRRTRLRGKWVRAMYQISGWAGTAILELRWDKFAGKEIAYCQDCNHTDRDLEAVGNPCPACTLENAAKAEETNAMRASMAQRMAEQNAMMGTPPPPPPPQVQPEPSQPMIQVNEGDVAIELLDPRDFFPEPGIAELDKMRWCCVREAVAVSDLRTDHPQHARYIHSQEGIYNDRTLGFFGGSSSTGEAAHLEDHAYRYRFYERATALNPKGRMITVVNHMIVEVRDNPYHWLGRLPFFRLRFDPKENEFFGESWVAHAWHQQKERNILGGQLRSWRELTLYPQRLVPFSARISAQEWGRKPGAQINYNPMGGPPKFMEVPQLPIYVYQEMDRMGRSIEEKAGVTDQEMGRSTGDPSGRYAAILDAQSSETIAPIAALNTEEWLELHRGILLFCQHYYSDDRTWTVHGQDRVRTYSWKDCNLNPGWDIELAEEDSLSSNPALRLQQTERLWAAGIFMDPKTGMPDTRAFKRMAGLKMPGVGPDPEAAERAYFSQLPEMIAAGQWQGPMPWDDFMVAADELTLWFRTAGRSAPESLLAAVYQAWDIYMQMAGLAHMPLPASIGQGATGQQPAAEAPTTGIGPGGQPQPATPAGEAQQTVQEADMAAEGMARAGAHEG